MTVKIDMHFKPDAYQSRLVDEFVMTMAWDEEAEFIEWVKTMCPSAHFHTRIPYGLYQPLVIGLSIPSTQDVMAFLLAWGWQ